ncbi:DUF4373 domain-containing protein [Bacteroides salyersiae]|uniref:DUF4373 domain-containing protein n=1 Tax=Bacteroides salyersiae TaxID=291644 RepID=UPI002165D2EF|nr:DUF4373 domain-containing protein [Bacteroides salyersiae]MCS3060069.1 DUF4373 domain-containing protein [Bacteroides salyersiae]
MAIEYIGINYFPLLTGFFHCDKIELLTAIFGIKGPYAVIMLLCKIYTDGYYIPWGKEQCMIFARKLGPEYDKETMGDIVNMLVEKEFFDKESYEKYEILTSTEIQKVWMEATSRRKRDLAKLPYLLIECTDSKSNNKNNSKNECKKLDDADNMQTEMKLNTENADSVQTETELNAENADIFQQSKVKQSKAEKSKELPPSNPPTGKKDGYEDNYALLPSPPDYTLDEHTHNYYGLLENLKLHKVKEIAEITAILRLSDYGRKGTAIWKLLAKTHWNKIEAPGKYIIKVLRSS